MYKILTTIFFLTILIELNAQNLAFERFKTVHFYSDSAIIDSFIIKPNSVRYLSISKDSCIKINYSNATIYRKCAIDSIKIAYSVLPWRVKQNYAYKAMPKIIPQYYFDIENSYNQVNYSSPQNSSELDVYGDFSRGINVSSNGQLNMNNQLDLSIKGKIGQQTELKAIIKDKQIPIQPEGITTTLEELEQIYIELNHPNYVIKAGDYFVNYNKNLFKLNKKIKGLGFESSIKNYKQSTHLSQAKGKFRRLKIIATTGNQGPYRLNGNQNESPIIVLANTERVYINGILLKRGENFDYIIDYNNGEVFFTSKQIISSVMRIVVEYEYKISQLSNSIFHSSEFNQNKWQFGIDYYAEQESKSNFIENTADSVLIQQVYDGEFANSYIETQAYSLADIASNNALYRLKDTLINDSVIQNIFELSRDSTQLLYNVEFSYVGTSKGNYKISTNNSVSIIFEWLADKQGDYEAVKKIDIPQKKQWLQTRSSKQIGNSGLLSIDMLNYFQDKNRISPNNEQEKAYALHLLYKDSISINQYIKGFLDFDFYSQSNDLQTIEPIFGNEFIRNWNLTDSFIYTDFQNTKLSFSLNNTEKWTNKVQLATISQGDELQAVQTSWHSELNTEKWNSIGQGFFTQNFTNLGKEQFSKHTQTINYKLDSLLLYTQVDAEYKQTNNILFDNKYIDIKTGTNKNDSISHNFEMYYRYRLEEKSTNATNKNIYSTQALYLSKSKNSNNNQFTSTLSWQQETDSSQNIVQYYNIKLYDSWKTPRSVLSGQVLMESYASKEPQRIEQYIQVPNGQGYFKWIDYNNNQIQELGEFEKATMLNEANYQKIYRPSSNVQQYYNYKTNFRLNYDGINIKSINFLSKLLFAPVLIKLNWQTNSKSTNQNISFAEYQKNDSNSILNQSNKNALFNYRLKKIVLSTQYTDYSIFSLYVNGGELKSEKNSLFSLNYLPKNVFELNLSLQNRINNNSNRYYQTRNYSYLSKTYSASIFFSNVFFLDLRTKVSYNELHKTKFEHLGFIQTISLELSGKQAVLPINIKLNYLKINYLEEQNTPMAFEIIQHHRNGNNFDLDITFNIKLGQIWILSSMYQAQISSKAQFHSGNIKFSAKF